MINLKKYLKISLVYNYLKLIILFLILEIWLYFLASIFILFLRKFKKYFNIRFGKCRVDVIGNSIHNLDCYIGEKKISKKNSKDYFFVHGESCNSFLLKLVKRNLKIFWFVKYFYKVDKLLPGKSSLCVYPGDYRAIGLGTDPDKIISKTSNNIVFSDEENKFGFNYLQKIGIGSKKFICFVYRNESYKKKYYPKINFSYHNYRDTKIDSYYEALNYFTSKGYYIIRMGKGEEHPIKIKNDKIIDYSFSRSRSDFLDIWLMSQCEICFSSGTGLDDVAIAFRKPLLHVNLIPMAAIRSYYPNMLCIFKKLKFQGENKYLNTSKLIELNIENILFNQEYRSKNISIVDNSPEEIKKAAEEMYLRINNQWEDSEVSNNDQIRFWDKLFLSKNFSSGKRWINKGCKIGSNFLKENKHLLN